MSYIGNMTSILLDEINEIEKLIKFADDIAYGIWFASKAEKKIKELESDFEYYIEVTEIRKKSASDKAAAQMYNYFLSRIDRIKSAQDCGKME